VYEERFAKQEITEVHEVPSVEPRDVTNVTGMP